MTARGEKQKTSPDQPLEPIANVSAQLRVSGSTKSDIGSIGTAPIQYGRVKRSEEYLWSSAGGHMHGKKVK
jgi:hypothetical protein